VHWDDRTCGNPVTMFPIKKRINAELLIDRMAAFYIVETQLRFSTNVGD